MEKVKIVIEVDKQTGAFQVAGKEIDQFAAQTENAERRMTLMQIEANKMNEAFDQSKTATAGVTTALAGFAVGAAVISFLQAAVEESIHEAEALRVLKGSIESTGASWVVYKDQIEAFAKAQQEATRFQDDETYESMGRLARATNNVAQAMRATELAQDLAVKTGKTLAETTDLVNNLLLGQERAVKMATKEYGNYAGGARTAQEALDNLEKSVKGAAEAEGGALKARLQAKAAMADTAQIIGDMLAPAYALAAIEAKNFFQELSTGFGLFAPQKSAHEERIDQLKRERDALFTAQAELQHYGIYTKEQVEKNHELREALKLKNEELAKEKALLKEASSPAGEDSSLRARKDVEAAQQAADKRREISAKLADEVNKQINDEFDYKRMKLDEEVAAAQAAGVAKLQVMIDGQAQEIDLASFKAMREVQIAQEQAAAISEVDRKTLEDKKKNEKLQQEIEKTRKANFASTLEFISSLSTSKNKELALIGKASGIALAYINTGVAVTRALAAAPPPFNFALAAAVGAAGAAQIATIAGVQLAKGGVTDGSGVDGILAQIGEKRRKEAVLPLENPKAMSMVGKAIAAEGGAGGGEGGISVSFGDIIVNITNTDLTDPVALKVIASGLAQLIVDEAKEMITLTRLSSDMAEKNKEVAV